MAALRSLSPDENSAPPEIDTSKPHSARIYDYLLGGKDNFAADREVAEKTLKAWPSLRTAARENRAFIRRAVTYLTAEAGVTQFLDIGSGLPTAGNVHEVAQAINPTVRVVYVDNDPIVLAHGRALLSSTPEGRCAYLHADLRDPQAILDDETLRATFDFTRPVALILAAILHFFPDDENPAAILATLKAALPPGSYLVATHGTAEYSGERMKEGITRAYLRGGIRAQDRPADDFADLLFRDMALVSPGVVVLSQWRREGGSIVPSAAEVGANGAVARKL
jgi:O-methyltransferase involved in polyketide biosynthesis